MPAAYYWLQIAQIIVMALVGLLIFSVKTAFTTGRWDAAHTARLEELEKKHLAWDRRWDDGSERLSELASKVQALPDRLRLEFYPRAVQDARTEAALAERQALREELNRLWDALDRRRGPRP